MYLDPLYRVKLLHKAICKRSDNIAMRMNIKGKANSVVVVVGGRIRV
jgi:hypothetical protein